MIAIPELYPLPAPQGIMAKIFYILAHNMSVDLVRKAQGMIWKIATA